MTQMNKSQAILPRVFQKNSKKIKNQVSKFYCQLKKNYSDFQAMFEII